MRLGIGMWRERLRNIIIHFLFCIKWGKRMLEEKIKVNNLVKLFQMKIS